MLGVHVATWRRRLFYGWVIVGVGFVCQMITGINFQGFSTYLPLLESEFGWSKALLAAPVSMTQVEMAILGPFVGYLVDRLGPRAMITFGVAVFGLGLFLFGFVNSIWSFIAVFALMALGASFSSLLVVSTAINNWFHRGRTLGIGIATAGLGISGVIAIPLIVAAQGEFGWRNAAMVSGIAVLVIGIPFGLMMRDRPERYGLLPDGDPWPVDEGLDAKTPASTRLQVSVDFTLGEALHTSSFWLISFGIAIGMFAMSAVMVHQFSQMENEVGLTRGSAASVIMLMSAFNIGGRLFGGFLGDRISKRLLLGIALLGTGVAILILASATGLVQAMVFGVIYGTSWGIRTPVSNAIRGEYFGRTHYGKISGISHGLSAPFAVVGPVLVGWLADVQGDYQMALYLLGLVGLGASALLFMAKPPKHPSGALNS